MDEKLKLYTLKKLKKQIEFLRLELQETQYLFDRALIKFNKDFQETLKSGKSIDTLKVQLTDEEAKECNILFRRIATLTHPDKLGNNSKMEEEDKKKLEELYKPGELGFEDVTENEFYLEKSVSKLSEKIKHLQTTYAWVWYHEQNTDKKENLKQHIKRTYA